MLSEFELVPWSLKLVRASSTNRQVSFDNNNNNNNNVKQEESPPLRAHLLQIHANPHGRLAQARKSTCKEAMRALERPSLVGVVQMRLAVVGHRLAVAVDGNSRVVVLGVGGPVQRRIYLFGVSNDDSAVVFESSVSSPERADACAGFLEVRGDVT
jgi:hypothetical protein